MSDRADKRVSASVESPLDEEILLDHEYDGIREYDNPMPRWWVWTFWATFFFACGYFFWYQLSGKGEGRLAAYQEDVHEATEQQAKLAAAEKVTEESLQKVMANAGMVEAGKAVFMQRCVPCHGDHAQGIIGPNLTDDYWIHGQGKLMDIYGVVNGGVADKGMPAWGRQLSPIEVREAVAFVGTLRSTHVAGKAPQGNKIAAH